MKIIKHEERTAAETFGKVVIAYFGGFTSAFIGALMIWPTWNRIVADAVHLPHLTYWQVWGCVLVIRLMWPMQTTHHVLREWVEKP